MVFERDPSEKNAGPYIFLIIVGIIVIILAILFPPMSHETRWRPSSISEPLDHVVKGNGQ